MPKHATRTTFSKDHPPPPGPGRPRHPADLKAAKALTRTEYERLVNKYLHMPLEDLRKLSGRTDVTALEAMIIMLCSKGISQGDPVRLNFILERLIGKPKEPRRTMDVRLGRIPAHTELLGQTARIAYMELQKLEWKSKNEGLSFEEQKSLTMLSESLLDLSRRMEEAPEAEDIRNLSNDDLLKKAEEAVTGLKLITSGEKDAA